MGGNGYISFVLIMTDSFCNREIGLFCEGVGAYANHGLGAHVYFTTPSSFGIRLSKPPILKTGGEL